MKGNDDMRARACLKQAKTRDGEMMKWHSTPYPKWFSGKPKYH